MLGCWQCHNNFLKYIALEVEGQRVLFSRLERNPNEAITKYVAIENFVVSSCSGHTIINAKVVMISEKIPKYQGDSVRTCKKETNNCPGTFEMRQILP